MSDLAERIRERLSAVGKSAAAASIEAGLGRSAVQDILSGNSASPRLDTLEKLTAPLQCSIAYLVGADEPGAKRSQFYSDLTEDTIDMAAESGVFKKDFYKIGERGRYNNGREYPHVRDPRLPEYRIKLVRLNDSSLNEIGIYDGDVLHVATSDGHIQLSEGQTVLVRHTLHPVGLSELIVRTVQKRDGGFRLAAASSLAFDEFDISGASMGIENSYSTEDGYVDIEGLVVGLFRDLPIGDV